MRKLVLILFGFLALPPSAAMAQATEKQAVEEIKKLSGDIAFEGNDPSKPVIGINMNGNKKASKAMPHLTAFPRLETLILYGTGLQDSDLPTLRTVRRLKYLDLSFNRDISDASVEQLQGLDELEILNLDYLKITDAGAKQLQGLKKLKQLRIEGAAVTDAGLAHLGKLTELESLTLWMNPITDEGLVHLKALSKLRMLHLGRTKITGLGLVHLAAMTHLRELYLQETPLTDQGLKHLAALPSLEKLWLNGTKVTDAGVKTLQKEKPKLIVSR
jgi:Leucine-rich repeat (LRR) protein